MTAGDPGFRFLRGYEHKGWPALACVARAGVGVPIQVGAVLAPHLASTKSLLRILLVNYNNQ
jgi:hypothetical protein